MARVAFFAESLSEHLMGQLSWELIQTLLDQNHEVQVLTSREQNLDFIKPHPRLQVTQPFRRWKWLETLPVIPLLMNFRPDILHFAQPQGRVLRGWINSMNMVGAVHEMLGRPLVVTSLFDVTDQQGWRQNLGILLRRSDVITVTNSAQQNIVRSWLAPDRHTSRVQIFPISRWGLRLPAPQPARSERLAEITSPFTEWAVIPGPMSDHVSIGKVRDLILEILACSPQLGVVVAGGWGRVSVRERQALVAELTLQHAHDRVFWTGEIDLHETLAWMKGARLVALSTLGHGSLTLANQMRQALSLQRPILISYLQQVALDLPESLEAMMFVSVNLTREEQRRAIQQGLKSNTSGTPGSIERETLDQSGNFLSRLYVDGLEQKQNHT